MTYIPRETQERIATSVYFTERFRSGTRWQRRTPFGGGGTAAAGDPPKLVFADGQIDHGSSGTAKVATGSVGSETESTTSVTVHNSMNGIIVDGTMFFATKYTAESTDGTWQALPFYQIYQGMATQTIPRNDFGSVELFKNGARLLDASSDPISVTAYYDWGAGDNIESSHEIYVAWSHYEQLWRIRCP